MISVSSCEIKPRLITKVISKTQLMTDEVNLNKSMSIHIFVGQQVCKQAHTNAKLYCTLATVILLFIAQTHFLLHCTAMGPVLHTSLITYEIKWHIQDYKIVLIMIWLILFFECTYCWWLVCLDCVIWDNCTFMSWFKRGYRYSKPRSAMQRLAGGKTAT